MNAPFPEIPGFRIVELLGEGAMARVYLAIHESLERKVALKVMIGSLAADETSRQRFFAEAKDTAKFTHPGIVAIHTTGVHDGMPYLVLEYYASGTLKDQLRERSLRREAGGPKGFGYSTTEVLKIIHQLAQALDYAHSKNVIHRDLKPANILFKADGKAVISDFGIAKSVSDDRELTQTGFAIGTPAYMSPEQRLGGELDGRSDLYSLGVVFYELLTGEKPYRGSSRSYHDFQKELTAQVPKLPPQFAEVQPLLDRLIAKNPDERFARAADLVSAIECLSSFNPTLDDVTVIQPRPGKPTGGEGTVGTATVVAAPRRNRLLLLGGLGLMAAVAVVLLVLLGGDSLPEPEPVDQRTAGQIAQLVERADLYMDSGWLIDPPGSNAAEALQRILELQPGNRDALQRLSALEEEVINLVRYTRNAEDAETFDATVELALHYFPDSEGLRAFRDE